jgi:hypothetical protein
MHGGLPVPSTGRGHVCRAAWPHLKAAGHGSIVNTTSEAITGFVPKTTGITVGAIITPEDIAASLDTLMDPAGANVVGIDM